MELTELVYFTTIAQTGNMSRAAKKLQVSQPALSVAVRKLERDLNMQLFVRANNSIILNAAGKKAVVFAENILSQVSEMRHFFRTYGERNTAASLAFTDPGPYRLVLPFFQQKCTQTKISSLLLHADNEVGPTLEEKKADAVICLSLPRKNKKDFESISVAKEGLYLAVPKNHPLAKRKYIRLDTWTLLSLARVARMRSIWCRFGRNFPNAIKLLFTKIMNRLNKRPNKIPSRLWCLAAWPAAIIRKLTDVSLCPLTIKV